MAGISALGGRQNSTGSALDSYFGAESAASNSVDRFTSKRANYRAGAAMKARNYGGAADEFYDAGLLGEGSEVQNYGQAQEDRAKSIDAETVKKRGTFLVQLARGLKDVPDAERNAQFERFAPALKTLGADDDLIEQLRQAPKDNDALDMFAGGVEQQLVEFIKASDGSYTAASKETGQPLYQYQAPTPDKYEQVDPQKNLTLIPGRGGSVAAPGGGGGGQPRNLRNNNPGNIEDGEFAKSLPGYAGSDGRFAKFDSPEAGTQAQTRLLASYGARGFNTVAKIIGRWAPASDGNDVAAYSQFVANKVGVRPDQPLDLNNPQIAGAVAEAIKQFEGGPQTASNGNGGPRIVAAAQPKPGEGDPPPESGLKPIGGGFFQDNLGRTYQRNSAGVMQQSTGVGDAEIKKTVGNVMGLNNVLSAIDQLDQATKDLKRSDFGPYGKYAGDPAKFARAKAAATNLMMLLKGPEVFNLGVITGPDMAILEGVVQDPAKLGTMVLKGQILPQLQQLSTSIGQRYRAEKASFKTLGGNPDALQPIYISPSGKYGNGARSSAPSSGRRLSPAEAAKLRPGTKFIGMDGVERTRK